jgi:O-antigen ligase
MPMAPGIFPQFKNLYLLAVAALIPLMPPQDLSNENLLGFKQLLWMRSLPYNSIIFDYVNLISIFLFSIYWSLIRKKVTIPLIFPFSIILFGSLLATCNSTVFITNLVTLAQDMYLFVLFVVLYNALDDQRALRYFVICWLVVATLEASLMLFQLSTNLSVRVAGTVGEANGAGGYLATSLFFVLNPYVNLGLLAKAIFCLLTIGGIFATKSLSATLGALVGSLVVFTSYWLRLGLVRRVKLGLVALAVAMTAVAVFPHVASVPNFLDRGPGSAEGRGVIWKAGLESFINNPLGIGDWPSRLSGPVHGRWG